MSKALGGTSYLDVLRPDPGWEVDLALLASYSSDLVVMVASMLALAGLDDERGSGSKVDFASAHERLAGRLQFLVQSGRMSRPRVKPPVLGIMDRFVTMIDADERKGSWHPKIALVRYTHDEAELAQWRLWIGSRNLTRDSSYDLGLSFLSTDEDDGNTAGGVADLGRVLAELSGVTRYSPSAVYRELQTIRWQSPSGCRLSSVELRHGSGPYELPTCPDGLKELLVISPFLDGAVVRSLGSWGERGTTRLLLSTRGALAPLLKQAQKPTDGFDQLLFRDSPDVDPEVEQQGSDQDEAEEVLRGLHAKAIGAKTASGNVLWMGSPNATARAWSGQNTEVFAKLEIEDDIYQQLRDFVVDSEILPVDITDVIEPDPREEVLAETRRAVSATWDAHLHMEFGVPVLTGRVPFNPIGSPVEMEIGLLTSTLMQCPRDVDTLRLGTLPEHLLTEFVAVRITLDELSEEWILQAKFAEGLPAGRDQAALAHHLSPRVFLEWIRSLLHLDTIGDGGGDWDEAPSPPKRASRPSPGETPWWAPSLEEVLRAWSRNPEALDEVDRKLKAYGRYIRAHGQEEVDKEHLAIFEQFSKTWQLVRGELGGENHA